MQKSSKIYIAGHKGLVGSAIWRHLEREGYTNLIGRTSSELDLTDQRLVEEFFASEKPEYVVLAAAKVGGINANNVYRADFIYNNLEIQNNVISSSYKHKVRKLLFLGSVCIYPKAAPIPIKEEALLTGELEYTNEPYALAKIAGIKLCESYNLQYGTNYISVQPANLYGYNDNFDLETAHAFPMLVRKVILCKYLADGDMVALAKDLGVAESEVELTLAKHGITKRAGKVVLEIWGTGNTYREFMHCDDMAAGCVYMLNNVDFADLSKDLKEVRNTHINLGLGTDIMINDFVKLICSVVGVEIELEHDLSRPDGTYRRPMSVEKAHKLGWHHKIELEDGLKKTIDWYKASQDTL